MGIRTYFALLLRRVLIMPMILVCCAIAVIAQQTASTSAAQATNNNAVAPRTNVDTLTEIKKNGKLRVGVAKIVPWAFHNKDGKLVGFEIDVARKLARDLGVEVEFYPVSLKYLISDLLASRYDIIVSDLSITAERALKVNFSAPYNTTSVTLAANEKTSKGFRTIESFNKENITIGVVDGNVAEEIAAITFPNARIKIYDDDNALFKDLIESDSLSAAIADSPRPEVIAKLFPGIVATPLDKPLTTFPTAFAVRRGDSDFVNYLNSWIQERTVNGWLESRRKFWFKDPVQWWESL